MVCEEGAGSGRRIAEAHRWSFVGSGYVCMIVRCLPDGDVCL